jgi:hypothetical protein
MGLRGFGIATASGGWLEVGFGDSDGMAGPRGAQNLISYPITLNNIRFCKPIRAAVRRSFLGDLLRSGANRV